MELLQQACLAFFAATGLAFLVRAGLQRLFFTKENEIEVHVLLIVKEADAPSLKRTVTALRESTVCGRPVDSVRVDTRAAPEDVREEVCRWVRECSGGTVHPADGEREHIN